MLRFVINCQFTVSLLDELYTFFCSFSEKGLNEQKRLKTAKKVVRPAFSCAQQPKAGQNTQQLDHPDCIDSSNPKKYNLSLYLFLVY